MATNPPITIGPFANVPAPGSGVKSDWAQQITNYVLRTAWTAAPFNGNWSSYPGWQAVQYRKVGDTVELRGLALAGPTPPVQIFVLPVGFRPPATVLVGVYSTAPVSVRLDINNAGSVAVTGPVNGQFYSLEGIRFSTVA